jgi:hypothetical protein
MPSCVAHVCLCVNNYDIGDASIPAAHRLLVAVGEIFPNRTATGFIPTPGNVGNHGFMLVTKLPAPSVPMVAAA